MANIKISQLPSWSGTAADLRWFVMNNSGETETFKFSGYTSPFRKGSGADSIVSINLATTKAAGSNDFVQGLSNQITSTGGKSVVLGGESNTISDGTLNGIYGGKSNTIQGGGLESLILGGELNLINSGNYRAVILGGNSNVITNDNDNQILGGSGCENKGGYYSTIINGVENKFKDNYSRYSTIIGGLTNEMTATDRSFIAGSTTGKITNAGYYSVVLGVNTSTISSSGTNNMIFGSNNSTISGTGNKSSIIGGNNNTISRAENSGILHSVASSQNSSGVYNTSGVTLIGCASTDITNSNNTVVLGVTGRTLSTFDNSVIMDKPYIVGNIVYETTTVNDSGTVNINVFTDAVTVINVTGGTYDLTITPVPSDPGSIITLMIKYTSGTVNFVSGGALQWKWGNGLGAPTFSANTYSIIKMATWANNDLWEVSRSMNMS